MTTKRQIAFIDSSVADWETLVAGLGDGVEWILLEPGSDGLWQMANVLRGQSDVSTILVFSHGSSGELMLGDAVVNTGNLEQYKEALATIGSALTGNGDILLYGCNVAEGDGGQEFIAQLAAKTGADVAASDDLTGNAVLGGDWDLEYKIGDVSTTLVFPPGTVDNFQGLLDTSVSISVADAVVSENQGYAEFVVSLSAPSAQAVSVYYSSASGSAIQMGLTGGPDFAATGSQLLSFAAGETVKTVRVALVDDSVAENVESFYLNLSNPTNGVIGKSQGTATIIDNDGAAGTPVVSISDAVVDEKAGLAVFTLMLDRPARRR